MMKTLRCHRVRFYSPGDEEAFFGFARRIAGVREIRGEGEDVLLTVVFPLDDASLRDLLALFHRYGIEMSVLAAFLTPANRAWFTDPQKYWFQKIFPGGI